MTGDNRLPVLAGRVADLHGQIVGHEREAASKALDAGEALCEAKALVPHGQWAEWLRTARLSERTAQRYMQIARSPLNPSQVTDLGGMVAALSFLSRWRMPDPDKALHITVGDGDSENFAFVWQADDAPGHVNICAVAGEDCYATKRPMLPLVEIEGGKPVDTVLEWLGQREFGPMSDWTVRQVDLAPARMVIEPTLAFALLPWPEG